MLRCSEHRPGGRSQRVLLPGAQASVLAGVVLCFAHTVGEFGVVLMLGGSIPGVTRTLSISLYDQVQSGNYAAANHMALALVAVSLAALVVVYSMARPGSTAKGSPEPGTAGRGEP